MEWKPGALERIFALHDRILSHYPNLQHGVPHVDVGKQQPTETAKADEPPWEAPKGREEPSSWQTPAPENDLFDRMEAGEQRLKTKQKEQDDLKQREQKQRDGFDPWNRQDAANEKLQHDIENPNGASFQEDEEGLVNAYKDKTSTGVYYDPATRTQYVKGSVTGRDWLDDATKIPFWGNTRDAERYQEADSAYKNLQASGKPVDRIVGHSLGGSVALQMQKDHQIPKSRTFGAPVLDLGGTSYGEAERFRHPMDPVSVLDRSATWGKVKIYPHTYTGFEDLQ